MLSVLRQTCTVCQKSLLICHFYISKNYRVATACKACTIARVNRYRTSEQGRAKRKEYEQRPEVKAKAAANAGRYYHANKADILPKMRTYRRRGDVLVKRRATMAAYRSRPGALERRRAWTQTERGQASVRRSAQTEATRESQRLYHLTEKGIARDLRFRKTEKARAIWRRSGAKRRARIAGQMGMVATLTAAEWEAIKQASGGACHYCGRTDRPLTQDHVLPLSRGGLHVKENIVPACGSCNSRKGNRLVPATSSAI